MVNLGLNYFMMVEPDQIGKPDKVPINDETTEKVKRILACCTKGRPYKGHHITKCGKSSSNCDFILPNGFITNSLAVYYVQYYRKNIPKEELQKIDILFNLIKYINPFGNSLKKVYK